MTNIFKKAKVSNEEKKKRILNSNSELIDGPEKKEVEE